MKVLLHKAFITGKCHAANITDYPCLTKQEVLFFKNLCLNILTGQQLFCGANRKSSRTVKEINKKLAKKYNVYHYHMAENCAKPGCRYAFFCKTFVPQQGYKTNSAVFHYLYDLSTQCIVFFGFSRVHDYGNFPSIGLPPLVHRLSYAASLTLNIREFLMYVKLSNQNNLPISQTHLNFFINLLEVISLSFLDTNNAENNLLFETFLRYCIEFSKQNSLNYFNLSKDDLSQLYIKMIN